MKIIFNSIALVTLFFGLSINILAQSKSPEWIVYDTTNSGLPSDGIKSIVIDSMGNKWIGAYGGLVKFDGATWTIWDTSNSGLPNNNVEIVILDSAENKWIGTDMGGLTKFDGTTWTTWTTSNSGLPSNFVNAISIDNTGNIWIGTIAGLTKFDGTTWTTWNTSNSNIPSNNVSCLAIDSFGNKWVGCDGVVKFDGITWTTFYSVIFPVCYASSIVVDQINNFWIGYGGCGISYYDGNSGVNYNTSNSELPNDGVGPLAIDTSYNLWIETNGGLTKFDGITWTTWDTINSELPDNNVSAIAIDTLGNKWIGTGYGGLAVFREGGVITKYKNVNNVLNKLDIYPNPCSGIFNIFQTNSFKLIEILNILGEVIYKTTFVNFTTTMKIDLSNAPKGIYFVRVDNGVENHIEKLVIK